MVGARNRTYSIPIPWSESITEPIPEPNPEPNPELAPKLIPELIPVPVPEPILELAPERNQSGNFHDNGFYK